MGPPWRPSGSLKCYGGSCRMIISPVFQQHFLLPKGLNVREPGHHGGLQCVKSVMVGPVEGPFTFSKRIGVADGRRSSSGSTTFREESTLAWSHYRSRIQHVTEAEGGFIHFFFFILFYISFSCNTKKQADLS